MLMFFWEGLDKTFGRVVLAACKLASDWNGARAAQESAGRKVSKVLLRLCSRTLWLSMASHGQGQPLSGFQTNS